MAVFDAINREVEWKIDIYFDGVDRAPLTVDRKNSLITAELLEEISSGDVPWGNVSANELSFTLYNKGGEFNPQNENGPYYRKIKMGVPVWAYCRGLNTDGSAAEWLPLGKFYVSSWSTKSGGIEAEIVCLDILSNALAGGVPKMPIYRDIQYTEFIQKVLEATVPGANVVSDFTQAGTLKYGYCVKEAKAALNDLSAGLLLGLFCDHNGDLHVSDLRKKREVAFTITDADQVIDISSTQSLQNDYAGYSVKLNEPQLSASKELLSLKDLVIPPAGVRAEGQQFTASPVAMISLARMFKNKLATPTITAATATDVSYEIKNPYREEFVDDFTIHGHIIETVSTEYLGGVDNSLSIDSPYVQTAAQISNMRRMLSLYISGILPMLEISVRGNPEMQLGQKIAVHSTRFETQFDGVLMRQQLKYDGGLSGTITLINSKLLEVE